MKRLSRPLLVTAFVATAASAGVAACNAIVGVEDVRLARDAGSPDTGRVDAEASVPDVTGPRPPFEVTAGGLHTCVKTRDETVKCWGDDTFSQTGTQAQADAGYLTAPQPVLAVSGVVQISAGREHTCAVKADGHAVCWGNGRSGQLGDGQNVARSATPVAVDKLDRAKTVGAGGDFTCALRDDGKVACWGANDAGQLGNGDEERNAAASPVAVSLGEATTVKLIATGSAHACAVTAGTGEVICWGSGESGQLGSGSPSSATPLPVPSLEDVAAVAAGTRFTCALTHAGKVYCWGANDIGQLGIGVATKDASAAPVAVKLDAVVTQIAAGDAHACALLEGGGIRCWGAADQGQLGDGKKREAGAGEPTPVAIAEVPGARSIAAGGRHSCATTADVIVCWGANARGQLGIGSTENAFSPEFVGKFGD